MDMKRRLWFLSAPAAALVLCLMVGTPSLKADTVAISFDNTTGQQLANGPFTLGFQFTVNSTITVTSLGAFDSGLNGLVQSHEVGLWDSASNLQTSTTVDAGVADPLINQFRYKAVAPVVLNPGTYRIGAVWLDGSDNNTFPGDANSGFATASQITFQQNSFIEGAVLTDPTTLDGPVPAYFGPNFTFTEAAVVPTPKTVWAGLSLFGCLIAARGFRMKRERALA